MKVFKVHKGKCDYPISNTAYNGEQSFVIKGRYSFWSQGKVTMNGLDVDSGYYSSVGDLELKVPKNSSVVFSRVPSLLKKTRRPIPVPDITPQDTIQARIDMAVGRALFQQEDGEEVNIEELDFDDFDDDERSDMVSSLYELADRLDSIDSSLPVNGEAPEPSGNPEEDAVDSITNGDEPPPVPDDEPQSIHPS